jgi:hypothetical protein
MFFSLPQCIHNLWLLFIINARNFTSTQEVGKKSEQDKYYIGPLLNYLNSAKLWLLLAIVAWEVGVVGEE